MDQAAHGPSPTLIKDLLVFLIAAGILVPAMRWLKIPNVIAFMLAGVALGPFALGHFSEQYPILTFFSITEPEAALPFAELGVLFLLFLLGVEFSFQRLWALRKVVLGAGATQTLLSAAVLAAAGWALGLDLAIAMVLGLAFALSSTAIVMQMMVEQKRAAQPVGQTSLGVLLFQDIMVAPILIFVGFVGIKSGANLGGVLLDALVRGLIAIAVIWALGQFVLGRVFRFATTIGGRDVLMALTLLTVVGAAAITYGAGLSVALGAFLAGLLVGETEFKHQTEVDLEPFKGLLLGIFFMTVGMGLDLPAIQEQLGPILAVMAGLIAVKVAIAYLACRLFAGGHRVGIETALLLAPAGEFAFIILTAAQSGRAISAETATFASAVAGLSMLLTPLLGQLGRRLAARAPEPVDAEGMELTDPSEMENHVVLAGYGRVGHAVARILTGEEVEILVLDRDPEKVHQAREDGLKAYVGDAARTEILELTGLARAVQFIVTVDDANRARDMVRCARALHGEIEIFARAHDGDHAARLVEAGAGHVVPEAVESGLQMAGMSLECFGYDTETVRDLLARVRDEEYRQA